MQDVPKIHAEYGSHNGHTRAYLSSLVGSCTPSGRHIHILKKTSKHRNGKRDRKDMHTDLKSLFANQERNTTNVFVS